MQTGLIVALDFSNKDALFALLPSLDPKHCILKVGSEMFTLFGTEFVRDLVGQGYRVFLDLKFHDIPNTVAKACEVAAGLGVWMINVHAMGGLNMMRAARQAISNAAHKPLLIAVTVLTSMESGELASIGIANTLDEQALQLALLAQQAGLDGVVCSVHEIEKIKNHCGKGFLCITPGIRFADAKKDDQKRIVTPQQAQEKGSDYIVVGRPITQALEPALVVQELLQILA